MEKLPQVLTMATAAYDPAWTDKDAYFLDRCAVIQQRIPVRHSSASVSGAATSCFRLKIRKLAREGGPKPP
jgi:hypothetical protein